MPTIYSKTADLQSRINVVKLYKDSTYTYLKNCNKVVIGYTQEGIQILKESCEYGGISDLGGIVQHIMYPISLYTAITGWGSMVSNISSYLSVSYNGTKNVPSFIRSSFIETKQLSSNASGWLGVQIPINLVSVVYGVPPINLPSRLNIISISNLSETITGTLYHGSSNLFSQIPGTLIRRAVTLNQVVHGWQLLQLQLQINSMVPTDLQFSINGGKFRIKRDLRGHLQFIAPVLLSSAIHGWDNKSLLGSIQQVTSPYDITSFINSIPHVNLNSYISGKLGISIPSNLRSYLSSYRYRDLTSIINSTNPVDLKTIISVLGESRSIISSIVPKIIYMAKIFKVSLLEKLDLNSMVNCFCVASDYTDLNSYIYSTPLKDLPCMIVGWSYGMADNVRNLPSYINTGNVYVEDQLQLKGFISTVVEHIDLNVYYTTNGRSKTLSVLDVVFTKRKHRDLVSKIKGILQSTNLRSSITSDIPYNFTSLPEWVNPKTREVFININNYEKRTTRFVDLMFDSLHKNLMQYFYVGGENKVYRVDKNKHWTLWFTGYSRTQNVEKYNVRKKVLFNLLKYSTVDEAVRDLMSRCAEYNKFNLSSTINAVLPTFSEFKSSLTVKSIKTWYKHLQSVLNTLYVSYGSLNSTIIGINLSASFNLSSYIIGKDYEPPSATKVNFNFTSSGYIPPTASGVDLAWTATQSEEFWK